MHTCKIPYSSREEAHFRKMGERKQRGRLSYDLLSAHPHPCQELGVSWNVRKLAGETVHCRGAQASLLRLNLPLCRYLNLDLRNIHRKTHSPRSLWGGEGKDHCPLCFATNGSLGGKGWLVCYFYMMML